MAISFESTRKHFTADLVIIGVVIIGVLIFAFISTRLGLGWEVEGKTEVLRDTQKEVTEDLLVYKGGILKLKDSELIFQPKTDGAIGVYLEGDSRISLEDSSVDSDDYRYTFTMGAMDGRNPRLELKRSKLLNHKGISMKDRSILIAKEATIGQVQVRDRVRVDASNSAILPVLFSEKRENYDGLSTGSQVNLEILSKKGWRLKLTDCQVENYQLSLRKGDDISITNSRGVILALHTSGETKKPVTLTAPSTSRPTSGSLDSLGFDLSWKDTVISALKLYAVGKDELSVTKGRILEAVLMRSSKVSLSDLMLECDVCSAAQESVLRLSGVTIAPTGVTQSVLLISGSAKVEISKSDISKLDIYIADEGILEITDSKLDMKRIENNGAGKVVIDGKEIEK